jgi:hypothetical protein
LDVKQYGYILFVHIRQTDRRAMTRPLHTLVLNAGSSSLKYAVYRVFETSDKVAVRCSGIVDRIGGSGGLRHIDHADPGSRPKVTEQAAEFPDHQAGLGAVMKLLERPDATGERLHIACVGHRVVSASLVFSIVYSSRDSTESDCLTGRKRTLPRHWINSGTVSPKGFCVRVCCTGSSAVMG